MPNLALDRQVEAKDTLTIADVKQFISDAREKRSDYILCADRSWNEIEKRNKKGRLYGGNDLDRQRRWTRFPLWWSCLKIRQPITFARLPLPVLKDTQGDDPIGRTACVVGERLIRGVLKTFDAFPEFSCSNDDFLVTNFGWGRWFYKRDENLEEEKIRVQAVQPPEPPPMMGPDGQPMPSEPLPPIYVTPSGEIIPEPLFDEFGPYILTGQKILVDNEEIFFESGLYSNLYVDPDARKWSQVTRLAFEYQYSYRQFIEKFGKTALDKLALGDIEQHRTGKPIIVFEYHDKFVKECRWFAENSEDFFQPTSMSTADIDAQGLEEVKERQEAAAYDNSDLFGLAGFFPCTEPLVINASTKEFWPTPEYFQVSDITDDIHSIVGRMILLTKAIRVRFFFDSSIAQLKSLIGETGEGGAIGIPNLEQSLMAGKGSLANLVAYFPVGEMIKGLTQMYLAFQQRMDMFYQITGISDLIRGQTNPDSDKTYGERQLEGKFALNRIEPFQRKLQEWIKNNYQLGMEMALKLFSDESLDEYITPQTLDEEDKGRYLPALELLRSNKRRRFRVDFETDSTIAINEQWKRQQATELANTLTKAMESVANVAETQPELAGTELKVLKHLIGEFSDGKLFVDEIQDSIQQVIDRVSQPDDKPDIESQKLQFEGQKFSAEMQFKQLQLQAEQQLEAATLAQKERLGQLEAQLEQLKMQNEAGFNLATLNQNAQKLQAEIGLSYEELAAKRAEFLLHIKEVASKTEVSQLELLLDQRVSQQKQQLEEVKAATERQIAILDEKEKLITEQRLQQEHQLNTITSMVELQKSLKELKEAPHPITVNLEQPKPQKKKRKGRIIRDATGVATELEFEEQDG